MTPSASKAQDHITIALGDERYPELLRAIPDRPAYRLDLGTSEVTRLR